MMGLWAALLAVSGQTPPPAVIMTDVRPAGPALQVWRVGEVRCGEQPQHPLLAQRPTSALSWAREVAPVTLRFRIDATGRPLGITREGSSFVPNADDLAPSLAASRFAPGPERRTCSVTFTAAHYAIADAPVDALMAYSTDARTGALPKSAWDRILGPTATCAAEPRPAPLTRAYPDFRTLPRVPGARSWSMVGFDINARGRPARMRTVAGSGNAALDRASIDAVARSRFTPGVRTGCLYPYWQAAATLTPPEPPTEESMRPAGATCPEHLPFVRQPVLTVPTAWNRRSIEGWAIVAYDVAPWGATGNWRVLAAEPSAEFGDWALNVVRPATKPPSTTGYVGCVDRVRFRIGDQARLWVNNRPVAGDPSLPPPD